MAIKWEEEALRTYVDIKFEGWSDHDREGILDMCMAASSPGLVDEIYVLLSRDHVKDLKSINRKVTEDIKLRIATSVENWVEFEAKQTGTVV